MTRGQLINKTVKYKTGYSETETAIYFITETHEFMTPMQIEWVDLEAVYHDVTKRFTIHFSVRIQDLLKFNPELIETL